MKERGKRTAIERRNDDLSFYYSTPAEFSCQKHPLVSVVGICPYCLNDRLVSLVCSECGEQRLSSNRTSNVAGDTGDAGDVARISALIEEKRMKQRKETTSMAKSQKTEEVVVFKRSSSSCVEIKRKNHRFLKIRTFFKKINPKKERDEKNNDSWVLDYNVGKKLGVSRSRSLCSFRANGYFIKSEEDGGSSYSGARSSFSAARSSSVNGGFCETMEHRKSNFEGRKSNFSETTENRKSNFSESEPPRRSCFEERKSNFSETEYPPRKSSFSETEYNKKGNNQTTSYNNNPGQSNYETSAMNFSRSVFSMKESYITGGEEPGFIDLKFDSSGGEVVLNENVLKYRRGGSCRLTTKKDKEKRKNQRSFKGWKWIFGHHQLHHHHRDS